MKKITKAVIPAAGLGTRFLPITKAIPKPMLSVIDKPTIQYIAEELSEAGIDDIIIVIAPGSDIIKRHFGAAPELEKRLLEDGKTELYNIERQTQKYNITFVEQNIPNGLAGAVMCTRPFVKDEPFALLLGDELLLKKDGEKSCIKNLIDIYEKTGKSTIAAMEVFGDDVSKYGNMGVGEDFGEYFSVNVIVEKPPLSEALSNYAIVGRYAMDGKVFGMLENLTVKNNEIYFTDALELLAENGELLGYGFSDDRYDVGDKFGYVKANVELALRNDALKEQTKELIKSLAEKL